MSGVTKTACDVMSGVTKTACDVMSEVTKTVWDVMSGVTKTAWDVSYGVANLCGRFCPGSAKNDMGCFVPGCFVRLPNYLHVYLKSLSTCTVILLPAHPASFAHKFLFQRVPASPGMQ